MKPVLRTTIILLLIVAVLAGELGCARSGRTLALSPASREPGQVSAAEFIGSHSAWKLRMLLWWADFPVGPHIDRGINLYRVSYWTTNYDGRPILASGLLGIPQTGLLRGIVSYQHGTNTLRAFGPSRPTLAEGILGAGIFAGGGYLYLAPDYIGFGASREIHPYLHKTSTVHAVVDLLRASRIVCEELQRPWPRNIYLTGFSQGGHATLAVHNAIDSSTDLNLYVRASAPVGAPCHLERESFPAALTGGGTVFLAYVAHSYCTIYGTSPERFVAQPYADSLATWFDGKHSIFSLVRELPSNARDLFTSDFLDAYNSGKPTWFLSRVAENEVRPWAVKAPIRLYYGDQDLEKSPDDAISFVESMTQLGGDVSIVRVGDYSHERSVFHAMPKIREWFDTFLDPHSVGHRLDQQIHEGGLCSRAEGAIASHGPERDRGQAIYIYGS